MERIERGWVMEERRRSESVCSSARRTVSTQPTKPKVFRLQPRICVMCDHAWRAKIPESRCFMLKCPNCLSDQPGEDNLTAVELRDQADKCNEVLAVREAAAAKRRKAAMADRAASAGMTSRG